MLKIHFFTVIHKYYSGYMHAVFRCKKDSGSTWEFRTHVKSVFFTADIFAVHSYPDQKNFWNLEEILSQCEQNYTHKVEDKSKWGCFCTANISAVKNTLFTCVLKAHVLPLYFLHQNKCKFYIRLNVIFYTGINAIFTRNKCNFYT